MQQRFNGSISGQVCSNDFLTSHFPPPPDTHTPAPPPPSTRSSPESPIPLPPVLSLSLYVALNGRVRSLGKTPLQITQFVQTTQLMVNSSRAAAGRPVVKAHHYIDTSRGNAVVSTDCKCYSHSARGCCAVFVVQCRTSHSTQRLQTATVLLLFFCRKEQETKQYGSADGVWVGGVRVGGMYVYNGFRVVLSQHSSGAA